MKFIEMKNFGKDHWSTLMYIETRCVDHRGVVATQHMRTNSATHPQFEHSGGWKQEYSSVLLSGIKKLGHDDWDCVEDLENAGLLENKGTGLHPIYKLTGEGWRIVGLLRRYRAAGGPLSTFTA